MKKLISFMVFVFFFLTSAVMHSVHAESNRAQTRNINPGQRYVHAGAYWGWGRRAHPQVWMRSQWARPRFYRRPAIRMRVW